ncbi:MAG TPA: hypothetical protein VGG06_19625 [Thermoanaerobaculia bacterium]
MTYRDDDAAATRPGRRPIFLLCTDLEAGRGGAALQKLVQLTMDVGGVGIPSDGELDDHDDSRLLVPHLEVRLGRSFHCQRGYACQKETSSLFSKKNRLISFCRGIANETHRFGRVGNGYSLSVSWNATSLSGKR